MLTDLNDSEAAIIQGEGEGKYTKNYRLSWVVSPQQLTQQVS